MFKYSIKTAWTEKQQACPWEICLGIADRCLCLTRMEFPPAPWTLIQASSLIPLGSITHTLSVEKPMCNSLALLPKGSRVSHAASFRQLVFWLYLASVRCFCSWNDAIERCVFSSPEPPVLSQRPSASQHFGAAICLSQVLPVFHWERFRWETKNINVRLLAEDGKLNCSLFVFVGETFFRLRLFKC